MAQPPPIQSTRAFVERLRRENEVLQIDEAIDPHLELAEIQRRVVARKGKAILFKNVKGTQFPVVTNLFGSQKRIEIAFGGRAEKLIQRAVNLAQDIFPPRLGKLWRARDLVWNLMKVGSKPVKTGPVLKCEIQGADVTKLPQIQCWPGDGGPFITLPLVYTEHPVSGKSNLGMYRIQMYDKNTCGMHIQIQRGGGFHYHEAEKNNRPLPAHIYIGGPPALTIAAISPLPEDVPEILLASLIMGKRLERIAANGLSPLPILAQADFCLVGAIPPHKRRPEGPFGDHYGYYSLRHDYPCFTVKKIFHRPDAMYPATVVGKPPQEDHYIACYLQELLKPLIGIVMPQVREVWAYEEAGVHSLVAAVVKNRYPREALTTALRIMGEGQLSLSKALMVTDQACDVKDFKRLLPIILERIDFKRDLFVISHISQDTLDYTGPKINEGSKAIFLGLGDPVRKLPTEFRGGFADNRFTEARVFCPGCLAVTGPSYGPSQESQKIAGILAQEASLKNWPLVFLLNDAREAVRTPQEFLWQTFTRFEPAADIYARATEVTRFHIALTPPVVIDCRMKPWYPAVLKSDPEVVAKLEPIFQKYRL